MTEGIFHTQTEYSIIQFIALEITTHRIKPVMNIKNPFIEMRDSAPLDFENNLSYNPIEDILRQAVLARGLEILCSPKVQDNFLKKLGY